MNCSNRASISAFAEVGAFLMPERIISRKRKKGIAMINFAQIKQGEIKRTEQKTRQQVIRCALTHRDYRRTQLADKHTTPRRVFTHRQTTPL